MSNLKIFTFLLIGAFYVTGIKSAIIKDTIELDQCKSLNCTDGCTKNYCGEIVCEIECESLNCEYGCTKNHCGDPICMKGI